MTTPVGFINPTPLTKKGIQEHNRQIQWIYTDKRGNALQFVPIDPEDKNAPRIGGCAFKTIFARNVHGGKWWIGKIGTE